MKEEVTFVDVDAFGKQAEVIAQYMKKKGRPLLIEGRLKSNEWEDKNTHQKVSKLRVVLESFSFIDSNRGDSAMLADAQRTRTAAAPMAPAAAAPAAASETEPQGAAPEEDDVPF